MSANVSPRSVPYFAPFLQLLWFVLDSTQRNWRILVAALSHSSDLGLTLFLTLKDTLNLRLLRND